MSLFTAIQEVGLAAFMYLPGVGLLLLGLTRLFAASGNESASTEMAPASGAPGARSGTGDSYESVRLTELGEVQTPMPATAYRLSGVIAVISFCPYRVFGLAGDDQATWSAVIEREGERIIPNPVLANRALVDEIKKIVGPGTPVIGTVVMADNVEFPPSMRPQDVIEQAGLPDYLRAFDEALRPRHGPDAVLAEGWRQLTAAVSAPKKGGAAKGPKIRLGLSGRPAAVLGPVLGGLAWFAVLAKLDTLNDLLLDLVVRMMD